MIPTKITFFKFLIPYVVSGKKIITIRDESESHYIPGSIVEVHALETDERACAIRIEKVEPLRYDDINEFHARQEYMELPALKKLIREIYPDIEDLFVITYSLSDSHKTL